MINKIKIINLIILKKLKIYKFLDFILNLEDKF